MSYTQRNVEICQMSTIDNYRILSAHCSMAFPSMFLKANTEFYAHVLILVLSPVQAE